MLHQWKKQIINTIRNQHLQKQPPNDAQVMLLWSPKKDSFRKSLSHPRNHHTRDNHDSGQQHNKSPIKRPTPQAPPHSAATHHPLRHPDVPFGERENKAFSISISHPPLHQTTGNPP
jgi:hypothetical protein